MSVTEALSEGLQVTVVGLVIVFSVLIILMLVLMAMKVIFYKDPEKAKKNETVEISVPAQSEAAAAASDTMPKADDEELIAVLTAAVAASLNTSTYSLSIKSYKRVGSTAPNWSKAGLNDVINSRF